MLEQNQNNSIKYSIIIPVFNEETAIRGVVSELTSFLKQHFFDNFELILVNDGSTDNTAQALTGLGIPFLKIISHPYNQGYGSALKTGARSSQGEFIAFYDGDGQHRPEDLFCLLKQADNYDMVIGDRGGQEVSRVRGWGKKFLNALANYLVSFKIPDLNSGLRVVRRDCFDKFAHLYPKGFSLSTTVTLVFIKHGFTVKYLPIEVQKRKGRSSLKFSDGFKTIQLIVRMIMLFSPLKIFLPVSFLFGVGSFASLLVDLLYYHFNLSQTTMLLFISAILFFSLGLIADQLAALRRELKL